MGIQVSLNENAMLNAAKYNGKNVRNGKFCEMKAKSRNMLFMTIISSHL